MHIHWVLCSWRVVWQIYGLECGHKNSAESPWAFPHKETSLGKGGGSRKRGNGLQGGYRNGWRVGDLCTEHSEIICTMTDLQIAIKLDVDNHGPQRKIHYMTSYKNLHDLLLSMANCIKANSQMSMKFGNLKCFVGFMPFYRVTQSTQNNYFVKQLQGAVCDIKNIHASQSVNPLHLL